MGSFGDTEVFELVGVYLLSKTAVLIDSDNIGLYRDAGLALIHNANVPKLDRLRKKHNCYIPKRRFEYKIETNLVETDFSNVIFNLSRGRYWPCNKRINTPLCILAKSNHPSSLAKYLPKVVNRKISDLSCDESAFNNVKVIHKSTLKHSGYESEMSHLQGETEIEKSFGLILGQGKTLKLTLGNAFSN